MFSKRRKFDESEDESEDDETAPSAVRALPPRPARGPSSMSPLSVRVLGPNTACLRRPLCSNTVDRTQKDAMVLSVRPRYPWRPVARERTRCGR